MAFWVSDDSDEISEPWDDDTLSTTATCGGTDDDEEAQDVIRCDICDDTDPKLYCITCTKSLCKSCTGEHASSETVTKHDIVRFQYRNQMPNVINCARHQLFTCELFCKKGKTAVCSKCISSKYHQKHALTELSGIFPSKIKEIEKDLENIEKYILTEYNTLKTQLINVSESQIIPNRYKTIREDIRQQEAKWIQKIKSEVETLLSKVDISEANHKKLLKREEWQNIVEGTEKAVKEKNRLTQLRKSQNDSSVLKYRSNMKSLRTISSWTKQTILKYSPGSLSSFGHLTELECYTIPSYQINFE